MPRSQRQWNYRSDSAGWEEETGRARRDEPEDRTSRCTIRGHPVPAACAGSLPGGRSELALLTGEEPVDVIPVGVDHEERHHEGEGDVIPRLPEERHGDGKAHGGAQRRERHVSREVQHGGEEDHEDEGGLRREEQHDPQRSGHPLPPLEAEVDREDVPQKHRPADQGEPVVGRWIEELPGERKGEDPFPDVEREGEDPRSPSERAHDVRRADVPRTGLPQIHIAVERPRDEDAERDGAEQVAEEDEEGAAEPRCVHGGYYVSSISSVRGRATPVSKAARSTASATFACIPRSRIEGTSSPADAHELMTLAAAIFIRLLILRARAFSAPRNTPGNASALLTPRPSAANEAPAARASSGRISGLGFDRARITCPLRIISLLMSPCTPVVQMTMSDDAMTSGSVAGLPPSFAKIACAPGLMSAPSILRTPKAIRSFEIPIPAAPRPTIPTVSFFTCIPTYLLAFSSAARTTTAVPCWSSCITGMSSISPRRSSISKHSGALISSSLIAPNVGEMEATVRMISSVSFDWMRMGMPLIPTSASKRAAFPSITGMPATAPMSPRPRMAVPFVTIATEFGMTVYSYASSGFRWMSLQTLATPGVYTFRIVEMLSMAMRDLTEIFPPRCISSTGSMMSEMMTPSTLPSSSRTPWSCASLSTKIVMSRVLYSRPYPTSLMSPMFPPAAPMAVATLPNNPGLSRTITPTVFTSLSIPFSICMAPS